VAELTAAVDANDSANIITGAIQIGSLVGQATLARGTLEAAFYAIFTTEQQTKYKLLLGGRYLVNRYRPQSSNEM
jgi:hypothetical protein